MFSFSLPIPENVFSKNNYLFSYLGGCGHPKTIVFYLSFICLSIYFHLSVVGILYCFSYKTTMDLHVVCLSFVLSQLSRPTDVSILHRRSKLCNSISGTGRT